MTSAPETAYATSSGASIAYQVVGDGPVDVVLVSHEGVVLEAMWEQPLIERALERLGAFSRLILFDHRGTGVSDPLPSDHRLALEDRIADMQAVMDAVGCDRVALLAASDGGPMSILYAATYPQRTQALILYGGSATSVQQPDYPWAKPLAQQRQEIEDDAKTLYETWGDRLPKTWSIPKVRISVT